MIQGPTEIGNKKTSLFVVKKHAKMESYLRKTFPDSTAIRCNGHKKNKASYVALFIGCYFSLRKLIRNTHNSPFPEADAISVNKLSMKLLFVNFDY